MVKKLIAAVMLIIVLSPFAYAETNVKIEGEDFYNETVTEMTNSSFSLKPADLINGLKKIFLSELVNSKRLLLSIILIAAASSVTNVIGQSLGKCGTSDVSFFACLTAVCTSCITYFIQALQYTKTAVAVMSGFITKLAPVLSTLLILSGKAASAAAFHPILTTGVYVMSLITENWVIPLVVYQTVLTAVNNLNGGLKISGMCRLISSITKWILAGAFTLFSGLCGIYGFSAPAFDSMSAKTMKFAVGSLVPVVGGFLSDTLDTVLSGSQLLKSAVGGAGICTVCAICAAPVIKIALISLMMKVCAAVCEPLADKRISKLLWDISSSVTLLFAVCLTVAALFVICIGIIVGATK